MFAHRVRSAALTLAGASLLAITAISTVAEAAPQLPGGLPVADIRATKVSRTVDFLNRNMLYVFKVKNHGPDAVTVWVRERCLAYDSHDMPFEPIKEYTRTYAPFEEHVISLRCHWPADGFMHRGDVYVRPVNGVDPDMSNNHALYAESHP